jgi:hypothetical protein
MEDNDFFPISCVYYIKNGIEYHNGRKETLQSKSKDDDDVIGAVLRYVRSVHD